VEIVVPGPFTGCSALSPSLTPTDQAVLDLTHPSAFLPNSQGQLHGTGGAISSAELVSLGPETVVYTINAGLHWSNGAPFKIADLIRWWRVARGATTITSGGYQDISSMVSSSDGGAVTVTFARPFAQWPTLFRDVARMPSAGGCSVSRLRRQPSLGPYRVVLATSSKIVLRSNAAWPVNYNRIPTITLVTHASLSHRPTLYVAYYPTLTHQLVTDLLQHPTTLGHFVPQSDIEELQFAPHTALTDSIVLRRSLSWLLHRTALVTGLYGGITFTPTVVDSVLFAQGQPGGPWAPANDVATTAATATPESDCYQCAFSRLQLLGWKRRAGEWWWHGAPVSLTMAVGASPVDRQTAVVLGQQWRQAGVGVRFVQATSDEQASALARTSRVEVAIVERPTDANPWEVASSFGPLQHRGPFASGYTWRSTNAALAMANANFNPLTAFPQWRSLDAALLATFAVRPLFTPPALTEWSPELANLATSITLPGLVDQVTNWGMTPSA